MIKFSHLCLLLVFITSLIQGQPQPCPPRPPGPPRHPPHPRRRPPLTRRWGRSGRGRADRGRHTPRVQRSCGGSPRDRHPLLPCSLCPGAQPGLLQGQRPISRPFRLPSRGQNGRNAFGGRTQGSIQASPGRALVGALRQGREDLQRIADRPVTIRRSPAPLVPLGAPAVQLIGWYLEADAALRDADRDHVAVLD